MANLIGQRKAPAEKPLTASQLKAREKVLAQIRNYISGFQRCRGTIPSAVHVSQKQLEQLRMQPGQYVGPTRIELAPK